MNIRRASFILYVAGIVLIACCQGCASGHNYHLAAAPAVPAATGAVHVSTDENGNTVIDLKVAHLADPHMLTPPRSTYVVWIRPENGEAQNAGELHVDNDLNGQFKNATPYRHFQIFITAENNPRMDHPTGQLLLQQNVSR
jgi:hypothetical protein